MGLMISVKAFSIPWNWFAYECQRANIASGGIAYECQSANIVSGGIAYDDLRIARDSKKIVRAQKRCNNISGGIVRNGKKIVRA